MHPKNALAERGRSTGWGWCAICGTDRGPGHDFTHGQGSGGGGSGYSTSDVAVSGFNAFMRGFNQAIQQRQQEMQRRNAEATRYNNIGVDYFKNGDYDNAIIYYEHALSIQPHDRQIRQNLNSARAEKAYDLAEEYYDADNFEMAVVYFKQAVNYTPYRKRREYFKERLGRAEYIIKDRIEKAKLAESKKRAGEALDELYEEIKDSPSSAVDLSFVEPEKKLIVDPRVVSGELTPGEAKLEREKTERIETAVLRARVSFSENNFNEAADFIKDALKEDPDDKKLQRALGYVLYREQKLEEEKEMEKLGKKLLYDEFKFINQHLLEAEIAGVVLSSSPTYKDTLSYLREEHLKDPDNVTLAGAYHYSLGMADGQDYVYPEQLDDMLYLPDRPPYTGKTKELVGKSLEAMRNDDFDGAIVYLREAHEASNRNDRGIVSALYYFEGRRTADMAAKYHSYKASFLMDAFEHGKGDWEKAVTYLEDKHKADPNNLNLVDALGYAEGLAHGVGGYDSKTLDSLKIVTPPVPLTEDASSASNAAIDAMGREDFEEAADIFKRLKNRYPNDAGFRWNYNYS